MKKIAILIYLCLTLIFSFQVLGEELPFTDQVLISTTTKNATAHGDFEMEDNLLVVDAQTSVKIELNMEGFQYRGNVGVDVVFAIDFSGSMLSNDEDNKRFDVIKNISEEFSQTRHELDRISVVLFPNIDNTSDAVLVQRWGTWRDTIETMDELSRATTTTHHLTPLAPAMDKVNNQYENSNRFYRVGILLSDGIPMTDGENRGQQNATIRNELIPEANDLRILYSTIFLADEGDEDGGILSYIARMTDYITSYDSGDEPPYFFKIAGTSDNEFREAYIELFNLLSDRVTAQNVKINETIDPHLKVDPNRPVVIYGPEVEQSRNVIGPPFAESVDAFQNTGSLQLRLNELKGPTTLEFSVKLDPESLDSNDIQRGHIIVPVNHSGSKISYLSPRTDGTTQEITLTSLPQTQIKFLLGPAVTKSFDAYSQKVEIETENSSLQPLMNVQIKEMPSMYVDSYNIKDEFDFKPFHKIYSALIKELAVNPPGSLPINDKLMKSLEAQLKSYLRQFSYYFDDGEKRYWKSVDNRGIYTQIDKFDSWKTQTLSFNVRGTSYILEQEDYEIFVLDTLVDDPASVYFWEQLDDWQDITPNHSHLQAIYRTPRPDLFIKTCFKTDIDKFYGSLNSLTLRPQHRRTWAMLDSKDIKFHFNAGINRLINNSRTMKMNFDLTVRNCGEAEARSKVKVNSIILGIGLSGDKEVWLPPISVSGAKEVSVPANSYKSLRISCTDFKPYLTKDVIPADPQQNVKPYGLIEYLRQMVDAVIINYVDIEPAEDEVSLSNNRAIEIIKLVKAR